MFEFIKKIVFGNRRASVPALVTNEPAGLSACNHVVSLVINTCSVCLASICFLLAVFAPSISTAGYANPKPVPGWKSGTPNTYKPSGAGRRDSANDNWYTGTGDVYLPGAGDIKFPFAMKEAANAANFLAKRTFIPATLAPLALSAMADWLAQAGLRTWIDPSTGEQVWAKPENGGTGNPYYLPASPPHWNGLSSFSSVAALGAAYAAAYGQPLISCSSTVCTYEDSHFIAPLKCQGNTVWNGAGCIVVSPGMRPVTQQEFEDAVSPLKIPPELPQHLPFGLPVEDPRINPRPFPFGDPLPWFSPSGDPYPAPAPRPDPDPYPWLEPGYDVSSSPKTTTEVDPWRLDVRPVVKPKPTGDPSDPDPATQNGGNNGSGGGVTKPPEKDPGLCALFPDILACEKLGDAPAQPDLDKKEVNVTVTPVSGFGAENGTCPATKNVTIYHGLSVALPWTPICDVATKFRPLILALAWFSAAYIVVGAARKD